MSDKKWFPQLTEKKQIEIARSAIKYCYPNSRILGATMNNDGEFECCLFYNTGEKESAKLRFHEYDIEGAFFQEDTKMNSIYRQYIMQALPQEKRMEYTTDALEYLIRELEDDMHTSLDQIKANTDHELDIFAVSEDNILDYSSSRAKQVIDYIRNKDILEQRSIRSDFANSAEEIVKDLAYSYASSFEPKSQNDLTALFMQAESTMYAIIKEKEIDD